MTRSTGIFTGLLLPLLALGQGGDQQLRAKADQLFAEQRFAEAMPHYSQLVSLRPSDRDLNFRFGACLLHGSADKEQAVGHLKFATEAPGTDPMAWYWLGRAYHLNYRFKEAQVAYQRFLGTAEKKAIAAWPVEALQKQCRNGERLLSSLKEITVRSKVEVADADFFRFYDLADIGGKIVVLPEELKSSLDKKRKERSVIYLPERPGPIYFSSYGKDGATGRDIYRTELLPDGTFATPVKLAGYINTDQDEDFPFMHPNGKTFYFSSKGHNSMGGYDVFRASYDRGLDAFGRPENLDFAVSTPDDDIFYIVDGEQKEACFASGRNSKQGMLHVYRVSTAQLPVVISVFKGTFASTIDPQDRKASITVEDALTQERVAEAVTDINGSYVLSVPRAGKYRYRVECGPSGKTHGGIVEVPKTDGPRAYRQELVLDRKGDLEQLTIRNYFDEPLNDDLVALSLEEIKRRARLDVSSREPLVAEAETAQEPARDIMTRAGFTGDIDQAAAQRLAKEDAKELEAEALDQEAQAAEAFALSVDAANEAERAAEQADRLVKAATGAGLDEGARNERMTEAARERQRSREATLRARAAFNAGQSLSTMAMNTRQKSLAAAKLADDLSATLAARQDEAALGHLRTLRQRLDEKSKPDAASDPVEQARRALAEQEKDASRLMGIARSKREEEGELADRIARLKRERDETRARSRKDEIVREITELEQQLAYQRKETEAAVNKATAAERQTAVLRGQASLTRHLAQVTDRGAGTELSADQAQELGLRISGTDQRLNALAIDERYDAQLAVEAERMEARSFDWDLASAAQAIGGARSVTRAMESGDEPSPQQADARPIAIQAPAVGVRTTERAEVAQAPMSGGREEVSPEVRTAAQFDQAVAQPAARVEQERAGIPEQAAGRIEAAGQGRTMVAEQRVNAAAPDEEKERFVLENERAELAQLEQAERSRLRKDSLQARMRAVDERILAIDRARDAAERDTLTADALEAVGEVDLSKPAIAFSGSASDQEVIALVYPAYSADLDRAARLADADARADAINGVESMLADSLRAEMQRQVAVLQLSPQQAETVLPRVDRLRRLREAHQTLGEQALAQRQQEIAASGDMSAGPQQPPVVATVESVPVQRASASDRFIVIDRYARNVYASKVEHRSAAKGVSEAIAFRDADLARMEDLTSRIDSMEGLLAGMPLGKESDRLRRKTDALIDERYIIRTDLGQRSAFLMREEWKTANDSLKRVEGTAAGRGLPMDEPLLQMAKELGIEARQQYESAQQLRKRADRSEDIVQRDSLYRRAYRDELAALLAMDKAITVQNYLAGADHQRGERLTYEEVAARVLGIQEPASPSMVLATGNEPARPSESSERQADGVQLEAQSAVARGEGGAAQRAQPDAPAPDGAARTDSAVARSEAPGGEGGGQEQEPDRSGNFRNADQAATPADKAPSSPAASAQDAIEQAERRLTPEARVPAQLYERYLASEPVVLSAPAKDAELDTDLLSIRVDRTRGEAVDADRRSVEAADRATAFADSAAGARKRDRERLERLAMRERALSDSLRSTKDRLVDQVQELERLRDETLVAKALRERLVKFYYLTPEEQEMVLMEGDASRYFQAKARALEQYEAADAASLSARSNRDVAGVLRNQARAAEQEARDGRLTATEAVDRAAKLDLRAAALEQKADSLETIASRLRGAAGINESQAGVMLQGMPPQRSSELMAIEQRVRRTEPLLAESRNEAAPQRPAGDLRMQRPVAPERVVQQPDRTSADRVAAADTTAIAERAAGRADDRASLAATRSTATAELPFRMPDELAEDIFLIQPAPVRREAPIPIDAELPAGIVFKVQIGAFRKPVPQEAFSDMSPVMGESVGNGLVRYTAGLFTGFDGAAAAKDLVRERGYRDAFVVAYKDGVRVPLGEAMRAAAAPPNAATAQARASEEPEPRRADPAQVQPPQAAVIQRPVQPIVAAAEPDAATILSKYPATAEELIGRFAPAAEAGAYYAVPGAAPAAQVESIKGLFFTVQVGVYSKPVALDRLFNITPLNSELTETAKVRYTTGRYPDNESARKRKDEAVARGVKDAFVTAYLNGKRIPVRDGLLLLERFGPSILAQP